MHMVLLYQLAKLHQTMETFIAQSKTTQLVERDTLLLQGSIEAQKEELSTSAETRQSISPTREQQETASTCSKSTVQATFTLLLVLIQLSLKQTTLMVDTLLSCEMSIIWPNILIYFNLSKLVLIKMK